MAAGPRVLSREVWYGFIVFLDLAAYSSHTNRRRGRRGIQSTRSFGRYSELCEKYKKVMSNVPQPVVVVTTAKYYPERKMWLKRGLTCSSFTSVSLDPPVVSFTMTIGSRMYELLRETRKFRVHVLAKDQVRHGIHFSKPAIDGVDQFADIPHETDANGIPVIDGASAVLFCGNHTTATIGDHHVCYGQVLNAATDKAAQEPMLYYLRSFHSIGDDSFMKAFEDTTLPFSDWTHEAHLRMAWNYIREDGVEKAIPRIKSGIQKYNEKNKDKISRGYNETVTLFYINMVNDAICRASPHGSFEEFIAKNRWLLDSSLLFSHYSLEVINSEQARKTFVEPDKKKSHIAFRVSQ